MGAIIPKLRASARGQQCTLQIVGVCTHDTYTTVLCHIHDETKGMGNKAEDTSAVFGCFACHRAIDLHSLPREDELFYLLRAYQRTIKFWIEHGYLVIPGVLNTRAKPSSKTVQRSSLYTQLTGEKP